MNPLRNKFRGALLGTFIGDAFGLPFEGTPRGDLKALSKKVRARASNKGHWGYSDDTEMMIGVAESLVKHGAFDASHMLETMRANYEPARGYGKALRIVLGKSEATNWKSKGCGAAVRVAPIACFFHDDEKSLITAAELSAKTTHLDQIAIIGTIVQASAISFLLRNVSVDTFEANVFLDHLRSHVPSECCEYRKKLDWISKTLEAKASTEQIIEHLGHSPIASEAVPAALYLILRNRTSFRETICRAVELGGDTDSIGALAGCLSGALYGASEIPEQWLENLENGPKGRDFVVQLADRLWACF